MSNEIAIVETVNISREELDRLVALANLGDSEAMLALGRVLNENRQIWQQVGDLAKHAEASLIRAIAGRDILLRESVARSANLLREQLGYKGSSQLEKLAIDRIVLGWLEINFLLAIFPPTSGEPTPAQKFGIKQRDSAQRRFDSAAKALATLRKLMPEKPAATSATPKTGKKRKKRKVRPAVPLALDDRMGWSLGSLVPSGS